MHFITAFNKVATQTRPIISIQLCLLWFFYFHTARIYQIKGIKSGPFEIHLSFSLSFDILVFVIRQKKRKLFLKRTHDNSIPFIIGYRVTTDDQIRNYACPLNWWVTYRDGVSCRIISYTRRVLFLDMSSICRPN